MLDDIKFCCKGVEILSSCDSHPLWQNGWNEGNQFMSYSLEYSRLRYCPCCGTYLGAYPEPAKPRPDDRNLCCGRMAANVMNPDEDDTEIFYQPFTRRYFFSMSRNNRRHATDDTIFQEWDFQYCTSCGRKLPEPLLDLWLEIVKTEFGVERQAPLEKMLPLVPEEYQTDWWWKKRGL